jgi:hypothetical protein
MLQLEIKSDAPDLEIVQNLVRAAIDAEIKNLQRSLDPTFSRLFKTKNNIYEKRLRETAKLDFVYH